VRLLLDSHIVLWWDTDLNKLSDDQRDAISDSSNQIFVSVATVWELGIKRTSGRVKLGESIRLLARRLGFVELPITMEHSELAASLPLHHKDPFDRMLVAQATVEGLTLVTADDGLRGYGVACL
jgi:PIN domain nuclease of toxin-antitoxin system